ncbi:MAG: PKD domain-containing protein [Chitinophagales bacterium]|nr:PKD domain-containing protein [Chitinophagales bacterium]
MPFTRVAFIFFVLIQSSFISFAQLQSASFRQQPSKSFIPKDFNNIENSRSQQCGQDTVYYPYAKATTLQGLNINTANSATRAGQWFDAPQQMMLYGFTFYAWQSSLTSDTVTLNCRVILAGADSLPTGPVVATTTVQVDSTFQNGKLSAIEKKAVFASPVLLDFPYVIVVETSSPISVALVTNDWDSADGGMEWLSMANIGGVWLPGYNINVGGVPFDADFVFNPIVTYNIDATFTADTNCILNGGTVDFTNMTNNPVLHSRFYNQYVFNGTEQLIYTWDYDDGSPLDLLRDTSHIFAAGEDYDVTLRSNMVGWSSVCQESSTIVINPSVTSDFTFTKTGLTVQFTNVSTGIINCFWSFGDGSTSTDINPTHTFTAEDNYNVTLITTGQCSGDTAKTIISLCNALSSTFTFMATELTVDFAVSAISGSTSFNWSFGDGTTVSGIAPSHLYDSAGAYTACLIATNSCESDTTCQQVNVISTGTAVLKQVEWGVYPNPAENEVTIRFKEANLKVHEISMIDEKGVIVKSWFPPKIEESITLNVSAIPPGTYYLKTKFAENRESGRMVLIR